MRTPGCWYFGCWPALVLIGIGIQYSLTGAGSLSADALISRRNETYVESTGKGRKCEN